MLVAEFLTAAALVAVPREIPPGPRTSQTATSPAGRVLTVGDHRTVRFVSLGGVRTDELSSRVADIIGGAVTDVEKFWGTDWNHEIVIVATGSQAQFISDTRLDPKQDWTDIAAVAVADSVDAGRRLTSGQRIVFGPGAADMDDKALRLVLTHELFHFAARADTAPDAPRWLIEGTADFVARHDEAMPARTAQSAELPTDASLDVAGDARSTAYDRAWLFTRFVADTYGLDGLRRLYIDACGPGHSGFSVAADRALGTDLMGLRAAWARWLTG